MNNWCIDCATFLRLTSAEYGDYGLYWIEESGIRGNFETSAESMRLLESDEQAFRLEFNRDAFIDFPVLAPKLVKWVAEQGGEFVLPPWFEAAVEASSCASVAMILDEATNLLQSALDPDHKEATGYYNRLSRFEVQSELDLIKRFRLEAAPGSGTARTRSDLMHVEIGLAIQDLGGGDPTPSAVMSRLRSYAGKKGSCVVGDGGDHVVWRRADGEPDRMDMKALRKRLERRRQGAKNANKHPVKPTPLSR